jgi:hypothetical protein
MKVLFKLDTNKKVISITGFEQEIISPENVYIELTQEQLNEYGNLVGNLFYEDGKFINKEINLKDKELKHERIMFLKEQLSNTDFKVIKCYEAQLSNEEMPYDLQTLLAQRKAWRDEINQLEFEISMLG